MDKKTIEIEMIEFQKTYDDFVFVDYPSSDIKECISLLNNYKTNIVSILKKEFRAIDINHILCKK